MFEQSQILLLGLHFICLVLYHVNSMSLILYNSDIFGRTEQHILFICVDVCVCVIFTSVIWIVFHFFTNNTIVMSSC